MATKEKTIIDQILDLYPGDEFLKADGFDDAIIGVCAITKRLIYERNRAIEILEAQGMGNTEANEHLEFNVLCAYVGPKTPIWTEIEWDI